MATGIKEINAGRKELDMLMIKYNVSAKEVFFAQLVACGMPLGDVFGALFGTDSPRKDKTARDYIGMRPSLSSLIKALSATATRADGNSPVPFDLRTKDGVIEAMQAEYAAAKDNKQRADILNKIADIQQMKKEEDKESQKLIHYYLPLRCEACPAYSVLTRKMQDAADKYADSGNEDDNENSQ